MRKLKTVLVIILIIIGFAELSYSQTAKINIEIQNFPWLLIEPYTYFKRDNEIKVEKVSENNFILSYFGKIPKSFFINFKEVLISPGDSITMIYRSINQIDNNSQGIIIASGNNKGNYIFSNFINNRMDRNSYPDYKQEKYINNISLLTSTLESNFTKYHKDVADTLKKYKVNEDFSAYLLRISNLKFLTALYYLNDNIKNNSSQKNELLKIIDNTFLNTNFVRSDTSYSYFMEIAFNNYFAKIVIPKFNHLKTETDYLNLIKYLNRFPNSFIKEYFVYFLASDYNSLTIKYKSDEYDQLISTNPYIRKTRYQIMDKSNIYR